jgi:propanol-preferring alcohol dehydrogenase
VFIPQGGTHPELHEVVDLARRGMVRSNIQRFDFTDTVEAYERLRNGDLEGRAVVVPS